MNTSPYRTCFYAAIICLLAIVSGTLAHTGFAQSVCLPAPRLLTTMPMGGQAGTQFEISITGENLDDADVISFSHPGITATQKLDDASQPMPNQFVVSIAEDCPVGIYEARLMTRLGISSSRIFSVGQLAELIQIKPNTTPETAMEIKIDSICNATTTVKAIDHYWFEAKSGQRIVVDCAAGGIDSKLKAVLVIADTAGRDLVVERRGGVLDFTAPSDGKYIVKVHDLTFQGGDAFFYRLALQQAPETGSLPRLPATRAVNAFSWPPAGLAEQAATSENEPNHEQPQVINLPCDIAGSFFPAADVDTFEFQAKAGEVWWIEVASERLGLPTDPTVIVQQVGPVASVGENTNAEQNASPTLTDVAELTDILSPVKVSSNAYAYDGPPYNAGSTDVLGKVEIKTDGIYRLQISDLFGGTRSDPNNIYRLIVRQAAPDFAVVAWAMHMELRNGDRNALSKPVALRGGATMALEVVVVRRDGFDGAIQLSMQGLPAGVTATGLTIPAGKTRGILLLTAHESAPPAMANVTFTAQAEINGSAVERPCHLASMAWPVRDAWSEIPSPRLLGDVLVSVSGELAPLSIAASESKVWEVTAGEKLTIPLALQRRSEFSGASMQVKTFGDGFESLPQFEIPLNADQSQVELDLAALKTPPGEYTIAFYGGAVANYRDNPGAVLIAEEAARKLEQQATELAAEAKRLSDAVANASAENKTVAEQAVAAVAEKQKTLAAKLAEATKRVEQLKTQSAPKDIVDLIVSEPISIRVKPAVAQ
jgi:hypothetical protein